MIIETKIEDIPYLTQEIKELDFATRILEKEGNGVFYNKFEKDEIPILVLEIRENEFKARTYIKYIEFDNYVKIRIKPTDELNFEELKNSVKNWAKKNYIKVLSMSQGFFGECFMQCGRVVTDKEIIL